MRVVIIAEADDDKIKELVRELNDNDGDVHGVVSIKDQATGDDLFVRFTEPTPDPEAQPDEPPPDQGADEWHRSYNPQAPATQPRTA